MKNTKSGKAWPYAIAAAITLVFGFCVATVIITSKANIQESDAYMTNYQDADVRANELINARIAFDKKYKLTYATPKIEENGCDVKYKLTTSDGKPVDDATMVLAISRPDTHAFDKKLEKPIVNDGLYVFQDVKFPKTGAWNLLVKVEVGDNYRFYDLKTDTRINHDRSITAASTY